MAGILVSLINPVKNKVAHLSNYKSLAPKLVLGSSSQYRAELLKRLRLPFSTESPNIDESPFPNEVASDTALRLANQKAIKVSENYSNAFVIGCDQVIECLGKRLDKPLTIERAREQLNWASGNTVKLYSAVCLVNTKSKKIYSDVIVAEIDYKNLSKREINSYLALEPSLDCAGGVKIEGLGISLIDRISCDDPSAIIGLPLISLTNMLHREGVSVISY